MKCMNHLTLEMITVFDTNSDMWVTEHVHDGVEARWSGPGTKVCRDDGQV